MASMPDTLGGRNPAAGTLKVGPRMMSRLVQGARGWHPWLVAPLLGVLALGASVWFAVFRPPPADAGALLTAASKILRGGIFYRDIDAYPFPGAHYLLALAMATFGEGLSVARALAAVFFCLLVVSLYAAALPVFGRKGAGLFGASLLSLKFLAWPSFTSYLYGDLAVTFGVGAVAILLWQLERPRSAAIVFAGALLGLSALCRQNVGFYLATAFGLFLLAPFSFIGFDALPMRRRAMLVGALCFGVAFPLVPVAGYFLSHGLLGAMIDSGIVRPFTGYLPTSGVSFIEPLQWWKFGGMRNGEGAAYFVEGYWQMLTRDLLPGRSSQATYWVLGELFARMAYTVIVVLLGIAALGWFREIRVRKEKSARKAGCLFLSATALLLSALPRADWAHIIVVYPLVVLAGAHALMLLSADIPFVRGKLCRCAGVGVTSLLIVTAGLAVYDHAQMPRKVELERAAWRDYEDSPVESVVRYVRDELDPGDRLFVYGSDAQYYFLAERFYPWPFLQLYPGQTGGAHGAELLKRLREKPPELVVRGMQRWPGLLQIVHYAGLVDRHIRVCYREVDDLWARYPLPLEGHPPPNWALQVLRPKARAQDRDVGEESCGTQPPAAP